jgi:hypothetical protein
MVITIQNAQGKYCGVKQGGTQETCAQSAAGVSETYTVINAGADNTFGLALFCIYEDNQCQKGMVVPEKAKVVATYPSQDRVTLKKKTTGKYCTSTSFGNCQSHSAENFQFKCIKNCNPTKEMNDKAASDKAAAYAKAKADKAKAGAKADADAKAAMDKAAEDEMNAKQKERGAKGKTTGDWPIGRPSTGAHVQSKELLIGKRQAAQKAGARRLMTSEQVEQQVTWLFA